MSTALVNQIQKQIIAMEKNLYDLQIDLQNAESEMANNDNMDIPFSEIWAATHPPPLNAEAEPFYLPLKTEAEPFYPQRAIGTKFKWTFSNETYRIAIARYDGVLEVKAVCDGRAYTHDWKACTCNSCSMINISGGQLPPWLKGPPLMKTFFKDEAVWRASLPAGGIVTVTEPMPSDRALKALCMKPLEATTDALRLKELEERFPGAKMVLSVWGDRQYEITYKKSLNYDSIQCEDAQISGIFFAQFGAYDKPQLMAEWRGLYIDLSHLF